MKLCVSGLVALLFCGCAGRKGKPNCNIDAIPIKECVLRYYVAERQKLADEGLDTVIFLDTNALLARKMIAEFESGKLKVASRRERAVVRKGDYIDRVTGKSGEVVWVSDILTGDSYREIAAGFNNTMWANADAVATLGMRVGTQGGSYFAVFLKKTNNVWSVIYMGLTAVI